MLWLRRGHGRTRAALLALAVVLCCAAGGLGVRRAFSHPRARATRLGVSSAEPLDPVAEARARLEQFEAERRHTTDFAHLPPANLTHGADPYALARFDAQHVIGVLRGASALVVLDTELREVARESVPESVVSVAVTGPGECWVAGETLPVLVHYRWDGQRLVRVETRKIPGVFGIPRPGDGPNGRSLRARCP